MSDTTNVTPSLKTMAQTSSASYAMNSKKNLTKRLEDTQAQTPKDYSVVPKWSNKDITTFKHNTHDHHIISHRGTHLNSNSTKKDLVADWNILTGQHTNDKTFKKRLKRTEAIVKGLGPDTEIHLSSHSLGGRTSLHAMEHSKKVRDRVKSVKTFNLGSSPFASKISHSAEVKEVLKKKIEHHRIQGDPVSMSAKSTLPGVHRSYSPPKKTVSISSKILGHIKPIIGKSPIGTLASLAGEHLTKALENHSIDNFT
jgi:hypothetical protein